MSHNVSITVDGETWMDGNPGTWIAREPQWVAKHMAANTGKPEPWRMPLMSVFADACRQGTNVTITVTTRGDGWAMDVTQDAQRR